MKQHDSAPGLGRLRLLAGYCGKIGVPDKVSFLLNRKQIDRPFLFFPILYLMSIGIYLLSVSTPGLANCNVDPKFSTCI